MLPKVSGVSLVVKKYQFKLWKMAPVMTPHLAKDAILDKVSALDVGADDYLVKLFLVCSWNL